MYQLWKHIFDRRTIENTKSIVEKVNSQNAVKEIVFK